MALERPQSIKPSSQLTLLCAVLLLLSVAASIGLGAGAVGPLEAWSALGGGGDAQARLVVLTLRLPRTLIAVLVGLALAGGGAMLQAAARNPLAEPGLLGVSAGSATAVVIAIALGLGHLHIIVAIGGALLGCALVLGAARLSGRGDDPVRLVLAGAALASILAASSATILLFDQRTADEVRFWTIGGIAGRSLAQVMPALPAVGLGLIGAAVVARPLAALALGEQVARGLGQHPQLIRASVVGCVALLVGAATAMAGPVGFVGLVVPLAARWLAGPDIRRALPVALALGPSFVLLADTLARLVASPAETPLGVVTALIGAPVLVLVVRRQRLPSL